MKKILDKVNKVVFTAGIVALITLVLIMVCSESDTIEGTWGMVSFGCILVIFVFAIMGLISMVMATIEGLKKDRRTFLKKMFSNVMGIALAYVVIYGVDCFRGGELQAFDLGKAVAQILAGAFAVIAGEYMILDHSKRRKPT